MTIFQVVAAAALVAWIGLAFARGGYWRADCRLPASGLTGTARSNGLGSIVAVIPARNEAPSIGRAVTSLLSCGEATLSAVIVVDDGSTDGTAEHARAAAMRTGDHHRLHVVAARPLPSGWVGKVWAMAEGFRAVGTLNPDSIGVLFTDADIEHDANDLQALIGKADADHLVLASLMVRLHCETVTERLLIPPFVYFFQKLYPFVWVADPRKSTAAAAGGCMLVRRQTLQAAGGLEPIRSELIDDCALAALLKRQGPIWLGLAGATRSLRPYDGLAGIWSMVARTAFTQLRYSLPALVGTVIGMLFLYVVPPVATVVGAITADAALVTIGAAGWVLIAALAWPTIRYYGLTVPWTGLVPVAALLYTGMTVDSARRHWSGKGGAWKGRTYAPVANNGETER